MDFFLHETAVIDSGAHVGNGTQIWHFSHVSENAKIGRDVSLGQGVFIGKEVYIGDRCKIQNNVSVYENVHLEEDVFCGPSMVFTNVINPRAFVSRKTEYLNTVVKKGASLGANCTVVCGVTVGAYSFVGAGAVVTKDVKPFALVVGVPAEQIGWISEHGERLSLPLVGRATARCPATAQEYVLDGDRLKKT